MCMHVVGYLDEKIRVMVKVDEVTVLFAAKNDPNHVDTYFHSGHPNAHILAEEVDKLPLSIIEDIIDRAANYDPNETMLYYRAIL